MKRLDINDLNEIYKASEEIDKSIFAEMRSNVLLVAGEHYTKNNKLFGRAREADSSTDKQKLRLTKNHLYRIVKTYVNGILDKVPGVQVLPKNETEMQDRKSAELNDAIWTDVKERHNVKSKFNRYADEFVNIGEVAVKVFWDSNKGDVVGYEQKLDDSDEPMFDEETFEAMEDRDRPVFSGDFCFETIHAFNLMRDPATETMHDSPYFIIRKMVSRKELKKVYTGDPEKQKMLTGTNSKDEFLVFNSNKAGYERIKNQVLVREIYYKPCLLYPEGYFYIWTEDGVLEEGVLPFGVFPIRWVGFDEYATTPRARSIIKVARPYQAEINRAASQMATHQITLGDDKIIYQAGNKLAQGALLPGVRGISYSGSAPSILPGRTGDQFLGYIQNQIEEMYRAVFLDKIAQKEENNLDPYSLLFRSMSQQAVYKPYVQKFEQFTVSICELVLELSRHYLSDDKVIAAVGKQEAINIPEFKSTIPMEYQINVEPMSDSIDTMMGKQMTMNHMMQYVGKDLDKEDIGRMMKNMPFVNNEEMFGDMTLDYQNITNDMLALERGEQIQVQPNDNNEYYIKKLDNRIKQSDFKLLDPMIQQNYMALKQGQQQEVTRKLQEIKQAQSEFVPTGGSMITVQMHMPDPDGDGTKQVRLPYEALQHLIKMLESQGMGLEQIEQMDQGTQAELSQMLMQGQQQGREQAQQEQMQQQMIPQGAVQDPSIIQ